MLFSYPTPLFFNCATFCPRIPRGAIEPSNLYMFGLVRGHRFDAKRNLALVRQLGGVLRVFPG